MINVKVWESFNGTQTPFAAMETRHCINAIQVVERNDPRYGVKHGAALPGLLAEVARRRLNGDKEAADFIASRKPPTIHNVGGFVHFGGDIVHDVPPVLRREFAGARERTQDERIRGTEVRLERLETKLGKLAMYPHERRLQALEAWSHPPVTGLVSSAEFDDKYNKLRDEFDRLETRMFAAERKLDRKPAPKRRRVAK